MTLAPSATHAAAAPTGAGPVDASPLPHLSRSGDGESVTIAGSTATMATVVRHAVAAGLPVIHVAAAASTNPARVLGLADRTGALCPGLDADLVVCDEAFGLRAVMRRGEWITRSRGPNR